MISFWKCCIGYCISMVLLLSLSTYGLAADYFSWTDENGNVHVSDSVQKVPEEYRDQLEKKIYPSSGASSTNAPVLSYPASRPPVADKRSEKPSKKIEVPYQAYEGSTKRIIVTVVFNGTVSAPMAIDTGAPETVISDRLAQKLGLFDEKNGRLIIAAGGIGGSQPAVRSIIDTIQVGEIESEFVPTTVIDDISDAFDGLLGLDFASKYSMSIDPNRKIVAFEKLPFDPNQPGGHDKEWWVSHFKEFSDYRSSWDAYSKSLGRKIHDSMQALGNDDVKRKDFADQQVREADKLLDKLDRYASQNSVPREWRQ